MASAGGSGPVTSPRPGVSTSAPSPPVTDGPGTDGLVSPGSTTAPMAGDMLGGAAAAHPEASAGSKGSFDPLQALKLGSLQLANMIRTAKPSASGHAAAEGTGSGAEAPVVARIRATAAGLSARAKEQGSRFYQASISTAASTAEGIKRLAQGEPLQSLCRAECSQHPCPQLVLAACTALVSGGGITTERIFKHNPPPELTERLAAAAGSLSLLPPGASPHAIAALLKQFLLGLPEPLLTYRLLPQWVAAGDNPASCAALLPQLPAANASTLRLLAQVCAHIHAEAATNEMDALALAEVLAPCVAWKPPPRPQPGQPGASAGAAGLMADLRKSLTRGASSEAAAAAAAATGAQGAGQQPQQHQQHDGGQQQHDEAARMQPLDEAELEAVVTVLEHMISSFSGVFGDGPAAGADAGAAAGPRSPGASNGGVLSG